VARPGRAVAGVTFGGSPSAGGCGVGDGSGTHHNAFVRIVIAPDKFAGTLSAVQAAQAIATGWARRAPADDLVQLPMADGGPGFVDALLAGLGGDLVSETVTGPLGGQVPAAILMVGETAYVESAQACGLHLLAEDDRDPGRATSKGVGELVVAAIANGARRVVIGLGGSGTNDGGAGLLAALGATSQPADALTWGPNALAQLESVDLTAAHDAVSGIELLAATDVDNPLLGLRGATNIFGAQKGVTDEDKHRFDAALERLAALSEARHEKSAGAGAAGGLGWALLALGARRVPGIATVAEALGLAGELSRSDLLISGEGSFDAQSAGGKVVVGVARMAEQAARPCVVIAGRVQVGNREMRAMGIESAYSMVEIAGQEASFGRPSEALAEVAERVARSWSR
jgi:glycerate 2-kinase